VTSAGESVGGEGSGPHSTSLVVRFYELDPYGHVNHATYIQYFETARVELLEEVGFGLAALAARGEQLVVIGLRTRFIGAAGLGDELMIESGVESWSRARSTWLQRTRRGDEVLVTQRVEFAATNAAGRAVRSPEDLLAAVSQFTVPADWLGKTAPR